MIITYCRTEHSEQWHVWVGYWKQADVQKAVQEVTNAAIKREKKSFKFHFHQVPWMNCKLQEDKNHMFHQPLYTQGYQHLFIQLKNSTILTWPQICKHFKMDIWAIEIERRPQIPEALKWTWSKCLGFLFNNMTNQSVLWPPFSISAYATFFKPHWYPNAPGMYAIVPPVLSFFFFKTCGHFRISGFKLRTK